MAQLQTSSDRPRDDTDWAIVTPSYDSDFVRCKILCRSIDMFVRGNWHHYIIVDPPDVVLFKPLSGPRRTIVSKTDVFPRGTYKFLDTRLSRSVRFRRIWWSWSGPVAGWQVQQIIKISIAAKIPQTGMLCCDSDMFFIREFDLSKLIRDGKFRLFRSLQRAPLKHNPDPEMYLTAESFLGISAIDRCYYLYGDNAITWKRADVVAMIGHVSNLHGMPWERIVRKPAMISENMMYGMFVDEVSGLAGNYFYESQSPCKTLFFKSPDPHFDLRRFCTETEPHHLAVGIQSNIGLGTAAIEAIFDDLAGSAK
jgi:Family of unknown function (DUF6492)